MGRTAIVVSHVRGLGPAQYLEEFLVSRCRVVLSIRHPLICDSYSKSEYRLFEDGLLVATGERQLRGPEGAIRCQEVILTVSWVRRLAPRADFFFGIDALNSFCGILLRSIRSTKRVIFYTIDWSPNRFDRRALNGIYHLTDRAAALLANETWNVSPAIDSGRWRGSVGEVIGQFAKKRTKIVEIGVVQIDRGAEDGSRVSNRLVFLGHLLEKQGLQLVIEALPAISNSFHDVELFVIGDGPFLSALKELVRKLGLTERVTFHGYVEDDNEVFQLLRSSSVGLAPYLPLEDSFTRFADPGKLKNYLAAGLPILMTRVPYNADALEESGCAMVIEPTAAGVENAVCRLLSEDFDTRVIRREKALNLMKGVDWESIFSNALTPVETGSD